MGYSNRGLLAAILREDLQAFAHKSFVQLHPGTEFLPNWHHEAICYQLEEVIRGHNTRLIINLPPRSLKSHFVSAALPAFILGEES